MAPDGWKSLLHDLLGRFPGGQDPESKAQRNPALLNE